MIKFLLTGGKPLGNSSDNLEILESAQGALFKANRYLVMTVVGLTLVIAFGIFEFLYSEFRSVSIGIDSIITSVAAVSTLLALFQASNHQELTALREQARELIEREKLLRVEEAELVEAAKVSRAKSSPSERGF